jgi:hypothetical protein
MTSQPLTKLNRVLVLPWCRNLGRYIPTSGRFGREHRLGDIVRIGRGRCRCVVVGRSGDRSIRVLIAAALGL